MRLLLLLVCVGCSEFDIHHREGEPPAEPEAAIEVTPTALTYGELSSGETEMQRFTLSSVVVLALVGS